MTLQLDKSSYLDTGGNGDFAFFEVTHKDLTILEGNTETEFGQQQPTVLPIIASQEENAAGQDGGTEGAVPPPPPPP